MEYFIFTFSTKASKKRHRYIELLAHVITNKSVLGCVPCYQTVISVAELHKQYSMFPAHSTHGCLVVTQF